MEPLLQLLSNIKLDASTHPQHYLIHKYWGRKPHNIISSYIKIFTDKGDKVLDPFMGSGGVVIESNKIGRKSIGVDLNPMACMIANETLRTQVKTNKIQDEFHRIIDSIPEDISKLSYVIDNQIHCRIDNAIWVDGEIKRIKYYKNGCKIVRDADERDRNLVLQSEILLANYSKRGLFYPKDKIMKYVRRNNKFQINELFTARNLLTAAYIFSQINLVKDETIRKPLQLIFTSALPNFSNMIPGDIRTVTGKSGWQISKFWVPSINTEKSVLNSLNSRLNKYLKGVEEISKVITKTPFTILNRSCEDLSFIKPKSIDYVFTDPPYGDSISYFALSSFWSSWLKHDVDYENEIIYDPYRDKRETDYQYRLEKAFTEVHKVLKDNKYMSFTFHNRHMKFWKIILDSCTKVGFKLISVRWTNQAVSSGTQGINRKNTLKGDFIYTFKKVKPISFSEDKKNGERIIYKIANKLVKKHGYVSSALLYEVLIPKLVTERAYYNSAGKILSIEDELSKILKYQADENGKYGWTI